MSKEERQQLENSITIFGPREQEEADKDIFNGVLLFFQNKTLEAEKIFFQKPSDPLATHCAGCNLFLKAMMTFADQDIAYANTLMQRTKLLTGIYANVYKTKTAPAQSQSLFSKIFSFGQQQQISNGEMRAAVIRAECGLLMGMMQLLQESMVGYVKAGWSLRRGYKDVSWCYQQLQHSPASAAPSPVTSPVTSPVKSAPPTSPSTPSSASSSSSPASPASSSRDLTPAPHSAFDKHTLGGIQFAFGSINVVLASLPPRVLKLVSFFGFSCDRDLGFNLLHKCFEGGGIRAPLASLFLSSLYVHLPSFVPILLPKYLPLAQEMITASLVQYPGSAMHLWLAGRTHRLSRALKESNESFIHAISALDSNANNIPQLKDLCYYDLGLNHLWLLEWEQAADYFQKLAKNNYWSKAFYVYAEAVCVYMKGNKEEAKTLFNSVPSLVVRKYGGRTLGVEQYVLRKVKMYTQLKYDLGCLPALEMIYIWNGFYCMPLPLLEKCLDLVNVDLNRAENSEKGKGQESSHEEKSEEGSEGDESGEDSDDEVQHQEDIQALLLLIKAVISQNLGETKYDDAMKSLEFVCRESHIEEDTFIKPFAYYELGMLHYFKKNLEEAKASFRKAREFSKYNFEYRLSFRLHMALTELSRESKEKPEPEPEPEPEEPTQEEVKAPATQKKKKKKKDKKKDKKKKGKN
eukprot:Phypoly_transcript_04468.p1 GENE.Phypoly_transcript_04468~~Phypoly_transcript_04468.p1  ORF type:complete len:714 (+),score=163.39 Phypoly_transcript_04468:74-2143(+)